MPLEIVGQQIEGNPPSWYRVLECPSCHSKNQTMTLVRYGQSSTVKSDQTMTGQSLGGAGAGFHMNHCGLRCDKCGYEEELKESSLEELREQRRKDKFSKVTLAGHQVPNAKEQHERSWPNLSFGRRPSIIDRYHEALKPQLIAMLKAVDKDGNYEYSYHDISEFVNERVKKEIMPDEALIDVSTIKRFAHKNGLHRAKERE